MLVLTRKSGESIVIGNGITVKVSQIAGNRVKLCIDAPREYRIQREELMDTVSCNGNVATRTPALHHCAVPR